MARDESHRRSASGSSAARCSPARVAPTELTRAARRARRSEGWHDLTAEDGTVALDLTKVVYVLVEHEEHRVGFGT